MRKLFSRLWDVVRRNPQAQKLLADVITHEVDKFLPPHI
jgi:hypothetical protein